MKTWLQSALGLVAALLFATVAAAQTFTIAVVPDTQNYSDITLPQLRGEQTFALEMQYLADQKEPKNIAFVTFVGDIIQHGDGRFRTPDSDTAPSGHAYLPAVDGVSLGENLRIDANDAGHPVYQVLQDFQANTVGPDGEAVSANGGGGWLRFMEFDVETKKIRFYTYSPLLDRYACRNGEATFGVAPSYSEFELDFPPQLLAGR